MSYAFKVGDYIAFTRTIQSPRPVRHRTDYKTGRPIVVPAIAKQVLPQSGEGQIVSLGKPQKIGDETYNTARVSAGAHLGGTVTVVLDDAVLKALPLTMDLGIDPIDNEVGPSIYSSDAKGIA